MNDRLIGIQWGVTVASRSQMLLMGLIPRVRNGGWSLGCGRTRPELSPPNQGSSWNDGETRLR